jgi:Lipid A 3-O-deacylase (PagL)
MILKRHFFLFIAFILPLITIGQNEGSKLKGISFEADYGYGFVMPHHESIAYFLEDHIQTFDFKIHKNTYGEKYWNQLYRYPVYGLGFYRSNLGNNDIYGYANAIYSYIKVPIFGSSDRINLSWQYAFGASYITNHFNIDENPGNLAIGSNLNIFMDFSLQTGIPLGKRLTLSNAVRFTHFSNGKVKSPNKGLNIVSASIGLIYQLKTMPEKAVIDCPKIENKNEYTLIYAGGIKSVSRYQHGYFYASSLMFDFNRKYSLKRNWSVGGDIFFDGTNKQFSDNLDQADILNNDLYQIGIHAGHDLVIGNLALIINIGAYVYTPVEVPAPIYSRVGFRYRIKNKFIINYTLKSHMAKASFIEWGIGYKFN